MLKEQFGGVEDSATKQNPASEIEEQREKYLEGLMAIYRELMPLAESCQLGIGNHGL